MLESNCPWANFPFDKVASPQKYKPKSVVVVRAIPSVYWENYSVVWVKFFQMSSMLSVLSMLAKVLESNCVLGLSGKILIHELCTVIAGPSIANFPGLGLLMHCTQQTANQIRNPFFEIFHFSW